MAGHTSKTSRQCPLFIQTIVAVNQNGMSSEKKGSWRPAIAERASFGRSVTPVRVTIGVPRAPKATGAVFAIRQSTAEESGLKPRPTIMAPAMATGVPNPAAPSMKAPKEKAISSAWILRSPESLVMLSLTISNLPVIRVIV